MTTVNYHMTDKTITLTYDGKIRTVNRGTEVGDEVLELIRADNLSKIPEVIDIAIKIQRADPGKRFDVIDGEVYCHGKPVPSELSKKMLNFLKEKLPIEIFLRFWENLDKNPTEHSKQQLFEFLENAHFPLTPDGCFIAYKVVRGNFKDMHTGTLDNSPGKVVKMDRDKVNHDPSQGCSTGLHVGSYKFASNFGSGILLEVKVNPRDVVSVPDHDAGKCRCCEYTVIGRIENEYKVEVVPKKVPATKPAQKEAAKAPTDQKKSAAPADISNIQIGPYAYKGTPVTKEAIDLAIKKGYNRVKPSKWAAALKQIGATTVVRKMLTKTKYDYYIAVGENHYRYQQVKVK